MPLIFSKYQKQKIKKKPINEHFDHKEFIQNHELKSQQNH